jgi:hypothetical protein
MPVIMMMKIALNGTYEQESDEGAADVRVLARLLFGYLRPRRSPARPIQTFFPTLIRDAVVSNRIAVVKLLIQENC